MKHLILLLLCSCFFTIQASTGVPAVPPGEGSGKGEDTARYSKHASPVGGIQELMKYIIYPEAAVAAGKEGTVILSAEIDELGNVGSVNILQAQGYGLEEAAVSALKKVRFIPAEKGGIKVKETVTLPVKFALATEPQDKKKPEGDVFKEADVMPFPVGGMAGFAQNIVYPPDARDEKIEGKVIVGCVIDTEGNAVSVKVIKGAHPLLDAAAVDAVKKTKFTPGEIKGKKVKVSIALPVSFRLQ